MARRICSSPNLLAGLFPALLILFCSCGREERPSLPTEPVEPPWFEDITSTCGLDFMHDPGPTGDYFFPQIMGSGGALLDFDNDGLLDVYLVHNGGEKSGRPNQLFRQEKDGRFREVSSGSGLDVSGYGMGAAVGDINNDGWVDLFLSEFGKSRLFLNSGEGKFREITQEAGIDNPLWGTSAAFLDYDRDGRLDLVVVNYVLYEQSVHCRSPRGRPGFCHPSTFPGSVAKLYRNRGVRAGGNVPNFEDVTVSSGLARRPGPGLGVLCADFDGDGWQDIFIANDSKPNHLWLNQRNGAFTESAVARGLATNRMGQAEADMGIAMGDVDGDGQFDIFVTHLVEETHTLWKQGPRGLFKDRTVASGLANPHWRGTGFGTVLADFDHDGSLDAAVVNGRVSEPRTGLESPGDSDFWRIYKERNQLFKNNGRGTFRDVSLANPAFSREAGVYRGLLCGDIDNDGALDLIVTSAAGPARVFRNTVGSRGHWIGLRLLDPQLHRDAYGAEVTVEAAEQRWTRSVNPGYSYLCSNDPRAHIGLGSATRIDRIVVLWPDGSREEFPGGDADRYLTLRKGEGQRR